MMPRTIRIAAAQIGAIHRDTPREEVLQRMINLLEDASNLGAEVVLFPELAFTTFFPRHLITSEAELSNFFEHDNITTSPQTAALFQKATSLSIDISIGFAESTPEKQNFNTSIYYHSKTQTLLSKYRKIHLPGTFEPFSNPAATNALEKQRHFLPGNRGFQAFRVPDLAQNTEPMFGMLICNDGRWPEAWRSLGLQGVDVVLCGYNNPAAFAPEELWGSDVGRSAAAAAAAAAEKAEEEDAWFHHRLVMQSNSCMNATFSVCAARCGLDDDGKYSLIGGSCIVDPEGKILSEAKTKGDEVVFAEIDLERCRQGKTKTFEFERHRRVEHDGRIAEQTGVVEPGRLSAGKDIAGSEVLGGISAAEKSIQMRPDVSYKKEGIRILVINPNATPSMTASCVSSVLPTLPPDVSVTPFTGPSNDAPTAIEGQVDAILSSAACFRSLIAQPELIATHDAILVACYSAHPLINMLREEFHLPVIGIMESSLLVSRTLGSKFGIVATSGRSAIAHWSNVAHYHMTPYCAGIESCDLGVLDLERLPREEVMKILQNVSRRLISQGAEVLCLGCAGMTEMKLALEEVVLQEGVQVVDGVVAGVQHLIGIVRMGGKTGKKGVWRSSADGRKRRGQEYV